jgi:hypothetical protein
MSAPEGTSLSGNDRSFAGTDENIEQDNCSGFEKNPSVPKRTGDGSFVGLDYTRPSSFLS